MNYFVFLLLLAGFSVVAFLGLPILMFLIFSSVSVGYRASLLIGLMPALCIRRSTTSGFLMRRNKDNGVQAEFTDIKTKNMVVSGNLNANVSLFGYSSFPLYGGVRGKIIFEYKNNQLNVIEISDGLVLSRDGVGEYIIDINANNSTGIHKGSCVVGNVRNSNGNTLQVATGGLHTIVVMPIFKIHTYLNFTVSTLSGTKTDPFEANLLLLG
jgi:hypothetical protein